MTLALHYHPLSSFCWKAEIALYEKAIAYQPNIVRFDDEASRAAFFALSPWGKMPVLRDEGRDLTVVESTLVIEYLETLVPGLVPADPDLAREARTWDRLLDNYVHAPMQRIIADRLRPADARDPYGVDQAKGELRRAYDIVEGRMAGREWIVGDGFSLADCAACPALYYADKVEPIGEGRPAAQAYLERLKARPSFARVLAEAEPYFHMYPAEA